LFTGIKNIKKMKNTNTNNANTTNISKEDLIKKITAKAAPDKSPVCMAICGA